MSKIPLLSSIIFPFACCIHIRDGKLNRYDSCFVGAYLKGTIYWEIT